MANDETILREVDQELAEDRHWEMFRKHGPAVIGGAVAIVLGVAGWQIWNVQKDSAAKADALEYRQAGELLEEDVESGRAALEALGEEDSGYATLARLRAAASYAQNGERLRAIEEFSAIYNDGGVQQRVRELARLRAAYLALADGRDAVMNHLGELANEKGPFWAHAQEALGLAALEVGDYETSLAIFRELLIDPTTGASIRMRAEDFAALASAGKEGVRISTDLQVDDILGVVGEDADHEGHDHGAEEQPETDLAETETDSEGADNADDGVDSTEEIESFNESETGN